jgi:hypothetical protein
MRFPKAFIFSSLAATEKWRHILVPRETRIDQRFPENIDPGRLNLAEMTAIR